MCGTSFGVFGLLESGDSIASLQIEDIYSPNKTKSKMGGKYNRRIHSLYAYA